ncbi:unnamed protein product [Gemmata massiliana]|uniref:Uncharacterized protein n=1 Tax=Gemmata massiliana TaxID=1210884 RepID=A0A6P2CS90_9BACT|nr:hypothetical protein [Gemmata massiliana]VTR91477.1 unnamed protein product [Gemmata massiliana]
MDVSLSLWSDAASLCIFDPALFEGMKPADAWPYHTNPGIRDGLFAIVGLQGGGGYILRLTSGDLTPAERELLNDTVGPLGVAVHSGQVYASGMDWPGEQAVHYHQCGAGMFVSVVAGDYDVLVHELRSTAAERGLPDYVAVFRQRTGSFPGVVEEPRFIGGREIEELIQRLNSESQPQD